MQTQDTITYGKLPYWKHNYHTATVTNRIEYGDGSADITLVCECGEAWQITAGLDD